MLNQSMGEKICSLRKKKGLTQNELAKKMNVTDKAVSKWERNLSYPDISSISKLAKILDVSVEELLQTTNLKKKSKLKEFVDVILLAVSLAMGIATIVLSILKRINEQDCNIMLAISIVCLSIFLLQNKE